MLKALALAIAVLNPTLARSTTASDLPVADVARINAALKAWLEVVEEDEQHLVFDRQESVLRLQHGRAVLRVCPLRTDLTDRGIQPIRQALSSHVRTYRRNHAYATPEPGPLDWEYYLVADATAECALRFSGGLLLFTSDTWRNSGAPALRLEEADLRALYNALEPGVPLIILPAGWNQYEEGSGE